MSNNNTFELALASAASLPMVKIDRTSYLKKELRAYCTDEQLAEAIKFNPAYAGINVSIIHQIAQKSINYETTKVTSISAAAGLPGGFAIAATIPADLTQYTAHLLRILQKLVYLYGWDDLIDENGFDDETSSLLTLFMGIMFGVNSAGVTLTKVSTLAAQQATKKIAQKALTKTFYYPIVKKIATAIGVKMTKDIFAKSVSKVIPVIGAAASGGLTYVTFKPMANKLEKHLSTLKFCDVNYYENLRSSPEVTSEQI